MKKPGNIENLTPFPKGTSGNPNGRPRKIPELDKLLAEVLDDGSDNTPAKQILEKLIKEAKAGNTRAAEILLDRAYGKAKQDVSISGGLTLVWQEQKTYAPDDQTDGGA